MSKKIVRVCDRCGKEYELHSGILKIQTGKFAVIHGEDVIYEENEFDLCDSCSEGLDNYLTMADVEEEE